jgi:hypothetical protein
MHRALKLSTPSMKSSECWLSLYWLPPDSESESAFAFQVEKKNHLRRRLMHEEERKGNKMSLTRNNASGIKHVRLSLNF